MSLTKGKQSDLITSDSSSNSNSQSALSGSSNAISISQSSANNIKVIQLGHDSFSSLPKYDDEYYPLKGGPTFVDQVFTKEQISSIYDSYDNSGLNMYDQSLTQGSLSNTQGIVVISPIVLGKCIEIKWKNLNMKANDIGIGAQGDIYTSGVDGRLYYYDWFKETWIKVNGDFDLGSINRVEVSTEGTPYVVTSSGSIYYMNIHNEWIKLPGCATDIAIGRGGEIYKIGCDIRSDGFGIYRLSHKNNEDVPIRKNCRCFRRNGFCPECHHGDMLYSNGDSHMFWHRLSGSGVRVTVDPKGFPYVVTSIGMIMKYENMNWRPVMTSGNSRDVAVSNEGELFFTNSDNSVYRVVNEMGEVYQLCGVARAIAVGPFSQPIVVGYDGNVFTSSKFNFN